jgi:hypothetical protein
MGDVGYHIGGFTSAREARLYHSYWNTRMAAEGGTKELGYRLETHIPPRRNTIFMYNGRDDLAKTVIDTLFDQLRLGRPVRIKRSFAGFTALCNFVLRFATEITPQVGPPFITHIINRDRAIRSHSSKDMTPLSDADFAAICEELGLEPQEGPDDG